MIVLERLAMEEVNVEMVSTTILVNARIDILAKTAKVSHSHELILL